MSRKDDDRIARAKSADHDAWNELYRLHGANLVALLRIVRLTDNAADAEDLAAFAWLTAAQDIKMFTGTSDGFGGWLFTIARRRAIRLNERALHPATPVAVGAPADLPARATFTDSDLEQVNAVTELLAPLQGRLRDVVACIDVLGWDNTTTAAALGITPGAVRIAHHRGLTALRRSLTG